MAVSSLCMSLWGILISSCNVLALMLLLLWLGKLLISSFSKHGSAEPPRRSDVFQGSGQGSARTQYYHVFLSHRGPDTKRTLVNVLHEFLASKGLSCFVDYNMRDGEQAWPAIVHAIRNSAVQVVVLSPNFAQSKWCLDEVYEIMQLPCSSHSVHVLPIFYKVDPSQLRYPKPGSPFDVSTKKYSSPADHERWSWALREISLLKGSLCEENRTFEGSMASEVVARVTELLKDSMPLYVDPYWVDHYSTLLEQAQTCLDVRENSNGKNIVSIGVTGVNKSNFAKLLFNKLHTQFSASCILLNVREQANSPHARGLVNLQAKLLKDLANVDKPIQHPDEGLALLLEHLKNIRCFIVLDDIDMDMKQLRSLLILNKHQLGGGSRLVLTSRYRHVLRYNWANVDKIFALGTEIESAVDNTSLVICYETKDVHAGFINHLKESFSMLGLSVSEMKGSHLFTAFQQPSASSTYIVILSQSFLDSAPLLKELDEASRCSDAKLVYVFYGMDKSAKDSFLDSMQLGTRAFTSGITCPTIGKQLLRSLSQKAAHYSVDLDNPKKSNTDVAFKALITNIVSNHLHHSHKVSVTSFPVGLMERQHELECLLKASSNEKVSIGIVGMGGLGKTTLVKSLYNKIHKKFEGSVLLLNVRAEANQNGLIHLQKFIFDNVLGIDQVVNFMSVAEGQALLYKRLLGTNTLLILDDVDDKSQLDALYSPLELGAGSRVIITSRNREVLQAAKVDKIYVMKHLNSDSAKMLFWWHAFLQPYPTEGLREIAQQVIDACQGLPLSLQVIGAHVYGHADIRFWKETLLHLKKNGKEIFDTLRVSVDALEKDLQEAFLDVACFLIGKPAETAVRVWKGCGWSALHYLEVLQNKSLISVDSRDGLIAMHDQIRDMGRYIASQRSPKTHVWDMEDVQALSQGDGDNLRGFSWISQEAKLCRTNALLGRLCHLKLLLLCNMRLEGNFPECCYNQIRWLQWQNSELNFLPRQLRTRVLRVLDLSGSTLLKVLWRSSKMDEVPEELLELNLSGCKALEELPQFDRFLRHLEWLSLKGCEGLKYLHNTINSLRELKFIDLSGCRSLQCLPVDLQGLFSLEKLLLTGCELLETLPEVGQLENLIEISLDSTRLTNLPSSFGQLKNLEKLSLSNCRSFVSLPYSIGGLEMLRICNLSGCVKLLELPDSFCELVNLEDLNLSGCDLHNLPGNIGNLEKLKILLLDQNPRLSRLPRSVGNLHSLKSLKLGSCPLADDGMPRELEGLGSLEELGMEHNYCILQIPQSFAHLGSLSTLFIHHCNRLTEIAFLPCNLRYVDMGHCPQLQKVSGLDLLKSLQQIVLCDCCKLEELIGLEGLESLESLNISGCSSLRGLSGLQTVKLLQLSGSGVVPSSQLLQMPALHHATWYGSEMPGDFPDNCMRNEINGVQYANTLVMTIDQIPIRQSPFAIFLWLVSHDQGWSDYPDQHGSYTASSTFIDGYLVRGGIRVGAGQLLYRNRHADSRNQVHLLILRPECELLVGAQAHDRLEFQARSLYPGSTITVTQASYKVVVGGLEQLQICLHNISSWAEQAISREPVYRPPPPQVPKIRGIPLQGFKTEDLIRYLKWKQRHQ